jgi:diguanylate cyclase (GGDEF)-like protein
MVSSSKALNMRMVSLPLPAEPTHIERLARVGAAEILRRWAESVRAERNASEPGDDKDVLLVESVSLMLAELLDVVEWGEGRAGPVRTHHAARLGREHARQLLDVRELVRDWQLLRLHIFHYMHEQAAQSAGLDPGDVSDMRRRVGLVVDEAMCETLSAFVEEKTGKLQHLSRTDGLTGLYNHLTFYEKLDEELRRARRYEAPLSVVLIDLDDFKTVNDTCGHQFGDALLVGCAGLMRSELRRTDIICRYGGDEFGVIMPETTGAAAHSIMGRLSDAFVKLGMEEGAPATFGMSFGLATHPENEGSLTRLVKLADEGLLLNKREKYQSSREG